MEAPASVHCEHRLAAAQREVARLRQHIRLDGDTIEDLQDQCGALFARLNEVAAIAARVPSLDAESSLERRRAETDETARFDEPQPRDQRPGIRGR